MFRHTIIITIIDHKCFCWRLHGGSYNLFFVFSQLHYINIYLEWYICLTTSSMNRFHADGPSGLCDPSHGSVTLQHCQRSGDIQTAYSVLL